jgi:hypothetical protein
MTISANGVLGRFDNPAWYGNQNGPTSPLGPRDLRALDALDVQPSPQSTAAGWPS